MKIESELLILKKVLLICIVCISIKGCSTIDSEKIIGIQPFGKIEQSTLETLRNTIQDVHGYEVVILPSKNLPKSAYVNIKSPRYRADSLLKYLLKTKPDSIDYILGFTAMDISTSKKDNTGNIKKPLAKYQDWGVFGLGYKPGKSCVVSSYRLKNNNKKLTLARYKKVCVHEIGHNLGLPHCIDKNCVMTDACESIKTVDNVNLALCEQCKSKI